MVLVKGGTEFGGRGGGEGVDVVGEDSDVGWEEGGGVVGVCSRWLGEWGVMIGCWVVVEWVVWCGWMGRVCDHCSACAM